MNSTWQGLVGNLAIVGLTISIWAHLSHSVRNTWPEFERVAFGLTVGMGAIASMILGIEIVPGVHMDLRGSLLLVAGLFGGPISASIAVATAAIYRIGIGGAGVELGVFAIVVAALIGTIAHALLRHRAPTLKHVVVCAAVAAAIGATVFGMGARAGSVEPMRTVGLQVVVVNFLATLVCGLLLIRLRQAEMERTILRAAFSQAPEFFYVKDRDGRFVIANENGTTRSPTPPNLSV